MGRLIGSHIFAGTSGLSPASCTSILIREGHSRCHGDHIWDATGFTLRSLSWPPLVSNNPVWVGDKSHTYPVSSCIYVYDSHSNILPGGQQAMRHSHVAVMFHHVPPVPCCTMVRSSPQRNSWVSEGRPCLVDNGRGKVLENVGKSSRMFCVKSRALKMLQHDSTKEQLVYAKYSQTWIKKLSSYWFRYSYKYIYK
jgi:hypothetical protein